MAKKLVFVKGGKPLVVLIDGIKTQIPPGNRELDENVLEQIMRTPSIKEITVYSPEDVKKIKAEEKAKAEEAEKEKAAQAKAEMDDLTKKKEALRLYEVKKALMDKEERISAIATEIDAIQSIIDEYKAKIDTLKAEGKALQEVKEVPRGTIAEEVSPTETKVEEVKPKKRGRK